MKIQHVLIAGKLSSDIKRIINEENFTQSFRFKEEKDVTTDDLKWADAYVSSKPTVNFDFYNMKWVHSLGAGVNNFLFNRKWNADVLLTRTICSFGQRISQYCLSYYLKDLQAHDYFQIQQWNKEWAPRTPDLITNQKVLVYGTGEIGQEVARLFSSLGMDVFGVSLSGNEKPPFTHVYKISSEYEMLSQTDLIINTLPLTDKTKHLFEENRLNQVNNAVFINVGRGASVKQTALYQALCSDKIRMAVLDVFEEEPLPANSQLWEHDKVIITPHISAVTTAEEATSCFLDTLHAIENGSVIKNKVDISRGY